MSKRLSLITFAAGTVALLVSAAAVAVSWSAAVFRAETGYLVRRGMTKPEILRRAGQPVDKQALAPSVNTGPIGGVYRELWFYRGEDGFYAVTFNGNRSVAIDVIPDR